MQNKFLMQYLPESRYKSFLTPSVLLIISKFYLAELFTERNNNSKIYQRCIFCVWIAYCKLIESIPTNSYGIDILLRYHICKIGMYRYRKSRSTTNRNLEQKVVNLKDKAATKSYCR